MAMTDATHYPCTAPRRGAPNLAIVLDPPRHAHNDMNASTQTSEIDQEETDGMSEMDGSMELYVPSFPPVSVAPKSSLLPILDYEFNARELCKQMILLEDHLTHSQKRCADCCVKHFLALEGLAEEAITLDHDKRLSSDPRYAALLSLPQEIRTLQARYFARPHDDANCRAIAQSLRQLRKQFQGACFGFIFQPHAGSYRPVAPSSGSGCANGQCAL
ncbi:hypothetical protein EBZ80_20470 [bacterium]|nr:hypothetical protein [bacterium]